MVERRPKKKSIEERNLLLYARMQKYRTKKREDKPVYDFAKALKEDKYVRDYYGKYLQPGDKDRIELANILFKLEWAIRERYLKILEPRNHPLQHISIREIFGNIKTFNNLSGEIMGLVYKGESFEKHSRRLERKYHLKKETILDMWAWTQNDFK